MAKYIKILFIGLILVGVIDFLAGKYLSKLYSKQQCGVLYNTNYAFDSTLADVLVFGSSRANHHYNCQIIEDSTGLSAYNTGRDGNFIFYQTALFKSIVNRYSPKLVILDFYGDFKNNQADYDAISSLLPYYRAHPEIKDIVLKKSPFERIKLSSGIYPYNSLITTMINGRMCFDSYGHNDIKQNGFVPLYGSLETPIDSMNTSQYYDIDSVKLEVFTQFFELAKQHEIPVIVAYSPVYYLYDNDFTLDIVKEVCNKYNVSFVDFSRDDTFLKRGNLFKDKVHLNEEGAVIYTNLILEQSSNVLRP